MDAAAHPTKPSTPPYGSPGAGQCISQSHVSRAAPSTAARLHMMVASAPSTRRRPLDRHRHHAIDAPPARWRRVHPRSHRSTRSTPRPGAAGFPPEGHRGVPGGAGAPAVRRRVRGERRRLPGDPGARAGRLGRTGRPNRPPRAHHQRTQGAPPRAVVSKTCNYTTETSREAESSVAASRLPQSHSPITLLARSRCDA